MSYTNYYAKKNMLHVSEAFIMGTQLDALIFGKNCRTLLSFWERAEENLRLLEKKLNRFDPDSEVSMINKEAQFNDVIISYRFRDLIYECVKYRMLTNGYFDITKHKDDVYDLGINYYQYNKPCIVFRRFGMSLDFGGIGKGFALRELRDSMQRNNITSALVNFGNSSTLAVGTHPDGDCWKIGIEDPWNKGVTLKTVELKDASLSVSGNLPGRPLHIINPNTGRYFAGRTMAAAIARDPVEAEVATTALLACLDDDSKVLPDPIMIDPELIETNADPNIYLSRRERLKFSNMLDNHAVANTPFSLKPLHLIDSFLLNEK
jgi:thiamine biosynthesis lipoprotein